VFVVVDESAWLGMAGGFAHEHDESVATLWGMWVDGVARRQGLGRQLVENVAGWAHDRGVVRLELGLSDRSTAAAELYDELGFVTTGERGSLASDPSIGETVFARPV
jgi:GNAT superfamily N-acetyltransferase